MTSRCRLCNGDMPKDRQGWEQICPKCRKNNHTYEKALVEIREVVLSDMFWEEETDENNKD